MLLPGGIRAALPEVNTRLRMVHGGRNTGLKCRWCIDPKRRSVFRCRAAACAKHGAGVQTAYYSETEKCPSLLRYVVGRETEPEHRGRTAPKRKSDFFAVLLCRTSRAGLFEWANDAKVRLSTPSAHFLGQKPPPPAIEVLFQPNWAACVCVISGGIPDVGSVEEISICLRFNAKQCTIVARGIPRYRQFGIRNI